MCDCEMLDNTRCLLFVQQIVEPTSYKTRLVSVVYNPIQSTIKMDCDRKLYNVAYRLIFSGYGIRTEDPWSDEPPSKKKVAKYSNSIFFLRQKWFENVITSSLCKRLYLQDFM